MKAIDRHLVDIEKLQSRYRFRRKIGSGGFSDVFQALHAETGEQVAVKMMQIERGPGDGDLSETKRRVDRFRQEMQLYGELEHPNIVKIIESGETDTGLLFIVFEYIPGRTLASILKTEGALSIARSCNLMSQVLEGLVVTHAKGIIHRDLKPENIMVVQGESVEGVKILDFGVSKFSANQWTGKSRLTQTREFLGTPLYASPEQLRGDPVTHKVDLYSWGLIALECLTGQYPYHSQSMPQVVQRHLSDAPVPMPTAVGDHRLGALLSWVLEKDPARRAGDTKTVMDRLRGLSLRGLIEQNGYLTDTAYDDRQILSAETPRPSRLPSYIEERKQITVLCFSLGFNCDAHLESSQVHDVFDEIYSDMMGQYISKVGEYGGYVVGNLGDRLMVYFGFPDVSDTDPRRAVRAAIELSALTTKRGAVLKNRHGVVLNHRIGLHTGMITVRSKSGEHLAPTGITPNLAGTLCSESEANSILVSESCYRLVKDIVECEEASLPRQSSALRSAGRVYRVLGEQRMDDFGTAAESGARRMIQREKELSILLEAWRRAREGEGGTAILLQGDAGIGKSRLAAECAARVRDESGVYMICRCVPESKTSALYPILEFLRTRLEISDMEPTDDIVRALEKKIISYGVSSRDAMPQLCFWFGIDSPLFPLPGCSPQRQKEMMLAVTAELLVKITAAAKGVLLIEDLHWADPTTLELLSRMLPDIKAQNAMLLMTARPVFTPQWNKRDVRVISIQGLDASGIEQVIRQTADDVSIPRETLSFMIERSDGVPLYAEELTKTIVDQETKTASAFPDIVPHSLRDLLMARLDRLGPAKETAQLASAIGRVFDFNLIARVSLRDEASLLADLDQLISANLIHQQLRVGNTLYIFHHALVRDAAYDSLTSESKAIAHRRIAETYEQELDGFAAANPDKLAQHWAAAGDYRKSTEYGRKAASFALQRSLYSETIEHAYEAIEWAKRLEDPGEAAESELRLHQLLRPALVATRGFAADQVVESIRRAESLVRERPVSIDLRFPVLWGMIVYHFSKPDYDKFADQLIHARGIAPDDGAVAALNGIEGHRAYSLGEFHRSKQLLESAESLYSPELHRDHAQQYGHDTLIFTLSTAGFLLTVMGYIGEAEAAIEKARAWAEELKSSHSQAMVQAYYLGVLHYRGDRRQTARRSDELMTFCERHDTPIWQFPANLLGGWAKGDLARSEQSLLFLKQMGVNQFAAYWNSVIGQIEIEKGDFERARERFTQSIEQAHEQRELFYVPELYRLRGDCRRQAGAAAG